MPEDERSRRRLGDATRERIADLAEGWSVDGAPAKPAAPDPPPAPAPVPVAAPAPAPASTPGPRKKPRTVPPPPPGSAERAALENAIVDDAKQDRARATTARAKPPTAPPPIPPARGSTKSPTVPPVIKPVPAKPPAAGPPVGVIKAAASGAARIAAPPTSPPAVKDRTPPVIVEGSLPSVTATGSAPRPTVPVGEFDSGIATVDEDRLRHLHAHATVRRDAADALLQTSGALDDATTLDPGHDEPRGDATEIQGPGVGVPSLPERTTSGRLRRHAQLRRQRGVMGDIRYVFTAVTGVRSARREVTELEQRQAVRQTSRRRHLITLGRTAAATDAFEHKALTAARDSLATIEDERAKHAGAVAASDAELERVRRDREAKRKEHADGIAACDAELADIAKKLEPLEKEAFAARKRADELRGSLARIDKQLAETEASLVSVRADRDPASIKADLATLRADRAAVERDEPPIAAMLDALNPRIAAHEAARTDAQKRRRELDDTEQRDHKRTAELLDAIGAKRKVVERAMSDAETARDRVLFELGERLYVDRPPVLAAQLSPIDAIDLELGESDRRMMELREILANVDKAKLMRGAIVLGLSTIVFGLVVAWAVSAMTT